MPLLWLFPDFRNEILLRAAKLMALWFSPDTKIDFVGCHL
jgi:hypothetical protein